MKMYIWNNPNKVSYGHSLLFVVADSIDNAIKQAAKGVMCEYGYIEDGKLPDPRVIAKLGDPERILDLPCAEWHEWSE